VIRNRLYWAGRAVSLAVGKPLAVGFGTR